MREAAHPLGRSRRISATSLVYLLPRFSRGMHAFSASPCHGVDDTATRLSVWCAKGLEQKRWRNYEGDVQARLDFLELVAFVGVGDVCPDVGIKDDASAHI